MICFAKRGFHQTTMLTISEEAGISVGLIYRYFESKDAVISAITEQHKQEINELIERARQAPTLLDSLEIFFTAHCCEDGPQILSPFVVDLFAEAGRNPRVAELVRSVVDTLVTGVTDLMERAPEMQNLPHRLDPREMAELIFATARGMMMRDVLELPHTPAAERRDRQLTVVRNLWRLLFEHANEPALA